MTPEDWQRVKPILDSALQLDSTQRPAFLNQACADASLRREIESLIAAHEEAGTGALNSTALSYATLDKGTRLGDFQILSLLGAGGMGEVYRARDLRLDRDVAIKVLPRFVSLDSERLRRFEQEAKAAAALNHPNILAVFHMGSYQDAPYLVSELLEGENLRQQVNRGPTPSRKTIDYAVQIAHGLAAAHEKGIVHRDLKPENLFVTRDGRIKILDFGLAKLLHTDGETHLTKQTLDTQPGAVMGTVGYMAPEQVRGLPADHRADIFAFGAILYELLTGKRAFHKSTLADTMSAILNEDPPPVSQTMPNIPPALERAVQRCLEKSPDQRFQSASDLAFALELSSDVSRVATSVPASVKSRTPWKWITATGIALILVSGVLLWWNSRASARLTEKDTVVLSDFANSTGDPIFDDTLKQALTAALRQSPFLNVLSDNKVSATLQLMTRPVNTPLTPEVAREVCLRANSKAWIGGSIASLGSEYVIGLKALNCQNGDILAQEQVTAASKEKVLDMLGQTAGKVRGELGESVASVQKFDIPLPQATTPSLEALKAFSVGRKTISERGTSAALPFFQHAVELDPNFASGYASLGKMYSNLREYTRAKELYAKAYSLREHARELNRRAVESLDRSGRKERAALERMNEVLREVALGNLTEARQGTISRLSQSTVVQDAEEDRALIFAWLGEAARAESLVDELNKQSPEGTIMQSVVLPTVRAEMELSNKNPERTIELLRAAAPYELTGDAFSAAYEGCVYPVYIRGQAYLALNEGAAAEAEFQKILVHPGIVRMCENEPLARLGLARAYVEQGETSKAKAAYQDFLTLWKDADPDIPILKEAKAESAKLE